jgi:hypothetical protein
VGQRERPWLPELRFPLDWLEPPRPPLDPVNCPFAFRPWARALASPPFWAMRRCCSSSMDAKPRRDPLRPPD